MHKSKLSLETLAVDSFETTRAAADARGTVHGHDAGTGGPQPTPPQYVDCTCAATCDCPSAYYWCGDGYHTLYSCDYTKNESCVISNACPTS
jgi:hypothetical protein